MPTCAICATSDKQWKVQKVEIWWTTFVQKIHLSNKYIPSAKTLYTEHLSNITFNYLCQNSWNYLCHFWNHKPFFTTHLLYIFSAQTLYTFYESNPKCQFLDFSLLELKLTKFLMSFFKHKMSYSSKFGYFSVPWGIILYFFSWNLYAIDKSSTSKHKFSDLTLLAWKFTKFLLFFKPKVGFSWNFASLFSVMRHNSCIFSSKSLYALEKRIQSKCKFSDFWLLAWKLIKFLVIFQTTSQFSLNFCNILQCYDT